MRINMQNKEKTNKDEKERNQGEKIVVITQYSKLLLEVLAELALWKQQ